MKNLLRYAAYYKSSLPNILISIVMALALIGMLLVSVVLIRDVFSALLGGSTVSVVVSKGALIILFLILTSGLRLFSQRFSLMAVRRAGTDLRNDIAAKALKFPREYYATLERGALQISIGLASDRVDNMGIVLLVQGLPALISGIFFIGLLLYINWQFTLLFLLLTPIVFYFQRTMHSRLNQYAHMLHHSALKIGRGFLFILISLDLIHMHGAENFEQNKMREDVDAHVNLEHKINWLRMVYLEGQILIISVASVVLLISGGMAVLNNLITVDSLLIFYIVLGMFASTSRPFWGAIPSIAIGSQALDLLYNQIFDIPSEPIYRGEKVFQFSGRVRFEKVGFAYGNKQILNNINFEIPEHGRVAIVGANGSGKTTLIYLLLGLYRPMQGLLFADNYSYDEVDLIELRKQIGIVSQKSLIFSGTVWENLTYGCPEATHEQVAQVCSLAGVDQFISNLANGYETYVGEQGTTLSGGQSQRIAIARALLHEPKLLILDEPTNHLDKESVEHIMRNLDSFKISPAILTISHHYDIARRADVVYQLKNGVLKKVNADVLKSNLL